MLTSDGRTSSEAAPTGAPRPRFASARQRERGERILEVTRAMLSEAGYHGVTLREVCARAGIARKTLYERYRSKDELVLAALAEVLRGVDARASRRAGEGGIDALLAYDAAVSRQIVRAPKYAAAMGHALFQAAPTDALVDALLGAAVRQHQSALALAHELGEIQPGTDIAMLARHLAAQSWGVILLWMKGLLELEQIDRETKKAHLMTLIAVTRGRRHEALRQSLAELH